MMLSDHPRDDLVPGDVPVLDGPLGEVDRLAVHTRAELLPEERAAGPSSDPEAQALAILAESEERVHAAEDLAAELDPHNPEYQAHEHRRSEETL